MLVLQEQKGKKVAVEVEELEVKSTPEVEEAKEEAKVEEAVEEAEEKAEEAAEAKVEKIQE
jgi:hypothetical protein